MKTLFICSGVNNKNYKGKGERGGEERGELEEEEASFCWRGNWCREDENIIYM